MSNQNQQLPLFEDGYGYDGGERIVTIKFLEWNAQGGSGGVPTRSGWKVAKMTAGQISLANLTEQQASEALRKIQRENKSLVIRHEQ